MLHAISPDMLKPWLADRYDNHTRDIYRYFILDEVARNCQISEAVKNQAPINASYLMTFHCPQHYGCLTAIGLHKVSDIFLFGNRKINFPEGFFAKKFCGNGELCVTLQRLRRGAPRLGITIVLWCNGSTTVFGSVCLGSNPGKTTHKKEGSPKAEWPNGFFLFFCPYLLFVSTHPIQTDFQHYEWSWCMVWPTKRLCEVSLLLRNIRPPRSRRRQNGRFADKMTPISPIKNI